MVKLIIFIFEKLWPAVVGNALGNDKTAGTHEFGHMTYDLCYEL